MVNLINLISEMIDDELNRLRNAGRILVDRLDTGPYKIFLLRNTYGYGSEYDVALTSDEEEFTTTYSQRDRVINRDRKDIVRNWRKISNKVEQWTIKYGPVGIGSMNKRKTEKYHNILSNLGLKVGEVEHIYGGTKFMVYPNSPDESNPN